MMRNRGVHILDNFPCFMTTAHTAADIATIKTAFKESVAELQEADFLPGRASRRRSWPSTPPSRRCRARAWAATRTAQPAWFVPNPDAPGKFMKVQAQ